VIALELDRVLARGAALEGSVVDAAGKPVEGAEIRLSDAGERLPFGRFETGGEPAGLSGPDGFFRIEDRSGELVGEFYMDLYAREGKQSGAWMDDAINRRRAGERMQHPVAYLTCNFSGPVGGRPAYFTHREVTTLFHEFGHGLHQLLTCIGELGVAGMAAGALWGFVHLGAWEPAAFGLERSFQLLFMIIIGGLGSIAGSFFGAAFFVLLPLALELLPRALGLAWSTATSSHLEHMVFGALIVFFLIAEPHGLARLWATGRQKLRLWPFPH